MEVIIVGNLVLLFFYEILHHRARAKNIEHGHIDFVRALEDYEQRTIKAAYQAAEEKRRANEEWLRKLNANR